MESTVSVSKGVFVFKNGLKSASSKGRRKKPQVSRSGNIFEEELWYQSYSRLWNSLEKKIEELNEDMFSRVLSDLVEFIKSSYSSNTTEIPTAALLTGINMPDHAAQFSALAKEIESSVSPHVAILNAQDCQTLKTLMEHLILQMVNARNEETDDDDEDDEIDVEATRFRVKKSQCSFALLQSWYEELYPKGFKNVLTVIIPDFEGFNEVALQDFIQIVSTYLPSLPFVLVFGVATSPSVLHRTLPYHVSSKVNIHIFKSQPSTTYLNNVLENIFLTDDCPFHLGGKLSALFTDVFLFYDFSVTGFIQNFKYAMIEHFNLGNSRALCTHKKHIDKILKQFEHEDFENVRRLYSFRALVEAETWKNRIKLLEDDEYFGKVLREKLDEIYKYLNSTHILLRCLLGLVGDLPKSPLGKQVRELYNLVTSKNISKTQEFKEAFQLLSFQSKDELTSKIINLCELLDLHCAHGKINSALYKSMQQQLIKFLQDLDDMANVDSDMEVEESEETALTSGTTMDRKQLKEKLLLMSKHDRPMNKYEKIRSKVLEYLQEVFRKNLKEPTDFVFHEIFFFNDMSVQNSVIGSHRAAIHTALNDPNSYLQCGCCEIPNDAAILNTMPDICIAYKLHLEYGKMINLYDWLQAFLSILDPVCADDDEDKRPVDPQLQARFTQSVAELEFLGFIKSSKRKTDHVARLTWGG